MTGIVDAAWFSVLPRSLIRCGRRLPVVTRVMLPRGTLAIHRSLLPSGSTELLAKLGHILPRHMVPGALFFVAALPRLASLKIDRAQLPAAIAPTGHLAFVGRDIRPRRELLACLENQCGGCTPMRRRDGTEPTGRTVQARLADPTSDQLPRAKQPDVSSTFHQ